MKSSVVGRTDMSFKRIVTLIEDRLIADMGTVSVKNRHDQQRTLLVSYSLSHFLFLLFPVL